MNILVTDKALKRALLRERRACGGDRYDEVWNGVYVMSPLANSQHQHIATRLGAILEIVLGIPGKAQVFVGLNVSDRSEDWTKNFRVPDIAVIFPANPAHIAESACIGGPDFVVEIVSKGDRSRQKRKFYAQIGVRELLVIDRDPWSIELYRLKEGALERVASSKVDLNEAVTSEVVPLAFRLVGEGEQVRIEVTGRENGERWVI